MKTKSSMVKLRFFSFSFFMAVAQVQAQESEKSFFLNDIPAFSSPSIWLYRENNAEIVAALQVTKEPISGNNEESTVEASNPLLLGNSEKQSVTEIANEPNTGFDASLQYREPENINHTELTTEAKKMPEPIGEDGVNKQFSREETVALIQRQRVENTEANVSLRKTVRMLIANNKELIAVITKAYDKIEKYNLEKQAFIEEIAVLKQQSILNIKEQSILQKKTEELIAENSKLQAIINDKKTVKLDTLEDKYSYSLGVMLFKQIVDRVKRNDYGDEKVNIDKVFDGVSEMYSNDLSLPMDEVNSYLADLDKKLSEKIELSENEIKKKLNGVKYTILPDGAYLVVEKKGAKPYSKGDEVVFELREALLSDKVIINNLHNKVIFGEGDFPVFLAESMKKGMKNGVVSIYAMADYFYNTESLPNGIQGMTPVKFTISFK